MTWRDHLVCKVEVVDGDTVHTWSTNLPMPSEVPLNELFAHNFKSTGKNLSLNHRKVLWTYANIDERIWNRAAKELQQWIKKLPISSQKKIHLDVHQGAAAVVLNLVCKQSKLNNDLHIRVHHAPLNWLKERYPQHKNKKVTLEQISYSECLWSKNRRAA